MSVGTGIGAAIAIGAGVSAAGAVTSGVLSYEGQKGVASADQSAAQLQAQEAQNALNFQEQEFNTQQANQAPFLQAGQKAVGNLSNMLAPGGQLSQGWTGTFQAPTAAEAEATPGYQFQLQQGQQALERSAAAQGGLLTGGTLKAEDQYAQGLASTDYQQAYNNAYTQYQTAYNTFQQNQANLFNRNASLAGLGQTTAGQLGQEGQAAASNVGNIDITTGAQQGQDLVNQASANASGYNAIGNSVSSSLGTGANALTLASLLGNQNGNYGNGLTGDPYVDVPGGTPASV